MSAPETAYQAWLTKAERDLLNVENNLAASRTPWGTVCFHAQQATEKVLKAFLVHHGKRPPRTHDLVALLARCVDTGADLRDLEGGLPRPDVLRRQRAVPGRPLRTR